MQRLVGLRSLVCIAGRMGMLSFDLVSLRRAAWIVCFALAPSVAAGAEEILADSTARDEMTIEGLANTYCLDCHTTDDPSGEFDLESVDLAKSQFSDPDLDTQPWERMLRRLAGRQMPPADAPRPSEEEYQQVTATIAKRLDRHADEFPSPGRTDSIRRMTRNEYRNAVRDLLDLDIDVSQMLPPDESSHGFDNVTVGELSPTLLSRYLRRHQDQPARRGSGRPGASGNHDSATGRPVTAGAHVPGLPLGTRGGTLFTHTFPQSGLIRDRTPLDAGPGRESGRVERATRTSMFWLIAAGSINSRSIRRPNARTTRTSIRTSRPGFT